MIAARDELFFSDNAWLLTVDTRSLAIISGHVEEQVDAIIPETRTNQLVIVAIVFSVFTGFAFVIPFLPLYVRELGIEEPEKAALWAGLLIGGSPLLAGLLAGVACGIIGTLVVVNRLVFVSGGIAHAAYGGIGLSNAAYAQAIDDIAGHYTSYALTGGAHSSIGMKGLLLFGNEVQKKTYLPRLASGDVHMHVRGRRALEITNQATGPAEEKPAWSSPITRDPHLAS